MKLSNIINNKLSARDVCALLMGIVGLIIFTLMWYGNETLVHSLTREDALIENLSAFLWLEASVICFYRIATSSQKSKLLLYFWGILCVICFGEEISWGQRIFSYSIIPIQYVNAQHEINLHNLIIFSQTFGLSKALKSGNWDNLNITPMVFFNMQRLFLMGFITYFFIIPLIVRFKRLNYLKDKYYYDPPSYLFLISIWPNIILFWATVTITGNLAFLEACEMFMAFTVLIYVVFYLYVNPENMSKD